MDWDGLKAEVVSVQSKKRKTAVIVGVKISISADVSSLYCLQDTIEIFVVYFIP
jgi:hypothetical protein